MFNQKLLKAKLIEKGFSIAVLCNNIGMCVATFYRKLSRNGDFSREEISKITTVVGLTDGDRDKIFFAN